MSDVFISYSRKNSAFAHRLIEKLIFLGKDAWVDCEGIPLTSPNWWADIQAGIEGADNFVFHPQPGLMASVVCNMELDYAMELSKRIVPVIYRDVETRDAFASIADFVPDEAMEERLAGKDPLIIARNNWQRLSRINWVFFRDNDDFDTAFETLITTVETDLEYVKAHTRYLVRAEKWKQENEDQRPDRLLFGKQIERAEAWLEKAEDYAVHVAASQEKKVSNPLPTDLQREFIQTSREQENQRQQKEQAAREAERRLVEPRPPWKEPTEMLSLSGWHSARFRRTEAIKRKGSPWCWLPIWSRCLLRPCLPRKCWRKSSMRPDQDAFLPDMKTW